MNILVQIVEDYDQKYKKEAEKELEWFKIQKSLEDVISNAALAKGPSGKRFNHQRRIQRSVLEQARKILLENIDKIRNAKNFDGLYNIIEELLQNLHGVGELYIYDTALRIGAKLGFEPDKIYLHRGTREGAKYLGLNFNRKYLKMAEIPHELRKLKPREIEDALCIYKDKLTKLANKVL